MAHRLFLFLFLFYGNTLFAQQRYLFTQPKMGSPFNLVFYAPDEATAARLSQQAFALIDSFNAIYSDYLPASEINELSATAGTNRFINVSPNLYNTLVASKKAWRMSGGTFDVTIGPLSQVWRKARKEKRFPADKEISEALQHTGFDKVVINTQTKQVQLTQQGMQLDMGGIAKGLIAQAVVNFIQSKGVPAVMADAGGDIVCGAPPPGKEGWSIGINIPGKEDELLDHTITLHSGAVATSGDMYQYMEQEGKRYSHIIHPRTGYGVTFQRNVTVIAADGATADWLATACSILPVNKAKKLARRMKAELLITQLQQWGLKVYTTKGFRRYWKKNQDNIAYF